MNLKFFLLNAENLFLLSDRPLRPSDVLKSEAEWQSLSTSIYPNKSIYKCTQIAKLILSESPDVVMLCEVGGAESLDHFNQLFLNGAYSSALLEGNSDRNIDVGFLIKKNLPLYFSIATNKNRTINGLGEKFSRDVAELSLFTKDINSPEILVLLTHLKSRLDPEGKDPRGTNRRSAELRTLLQIYQERLQKFPNTPILVAGDLNGNASKDLTDPEFASIYTDSDLQDVCSLAGLSTSESATFFQVGRRGTEGRQLDYCFLSQKWVSRLDLKSVRILSYLSPNGLPLDPPSSMAEKDILPSDHYPLVFQLKPIP